MATFKSEQLGQVTIPDGLVEEREACPNCGERDEDRLVWDADGWAIKCANCGTVYVP